MIDFQCLHRFVLLSIILWVEHYQSLDLSEFKLVENKLSEIDRKQLSDKLNQNKVAYRCQDDWNLGLFNVDLYHSKFALTEENLLKSLQNKRVAIVGDSIGFHFYNALYFYLQVFELPLSEADEQRNRGNLRKRKLYKHNVTIYWCKDALVNEFFVKGTYLNNECGNNVIQSSHYIIMAFGTWYKPKFQAKLKPPNDFMLNMIRNEREVYTVVDNIYNAITHQNSNVKLIWRLQPHLGNMDEYREQVFEYKNISISEMPIHNDGLYWSQSKRDSTWVRRFNDVIRYQAYRYNNTILDWHSLSYLYMDYFSKYHPAIAVHYDSIHYCAAGVPRGAILELLVLLKEHYFL